MVELLKNLNIINNNKINVKEYSTLTLAYIGDSIFEICARTYVLNTGNTQANKLHNKVKNLVSATAQAKMYNILEEFITEDELSILKRGRNAKSYSKSKNSDINDYRKATGIETLFGHLYLNEDYERIIKIFQKCLTILE